MRKKVHEIRRPEEYADTIEAPFSPACIRTYGAHAYGLRSPFPHSERRELAGLAKAAFNAWKLTVSKATRSTARLGTANIHH